MGNYTRGGVRSIAFVLPNGNTGAALYPGGYLDDAGVNNNIWVASGTIVGITASIQATAFPVELEVWDFCDRNTGRPLGDIRTYLLGAGANIAGIFDGLDPATGDAFGTPRFEGISAPAGDGRVAYIAANARLVSEIEIPSTDLVKIEDEIHCPHGMVVHLSSSTGVGDSKVTVHYIPHSTGGARKRISDRSVSTRVEQLPSM
jgi:hypothetical protein